MHPGSEVGDERLTAEGCCAGSLALDDRRGMDRVVVALTRGPLALAALLGLATPFCSCGALPAAAGVVRRRVRTRATGALGAYWRQGIAADVAAARVLRELRGAMAKRPVDIPDAALAVQGPGGDIDLDLNFNGRPVVVSVTCTPMQFGSVSYTKKLLL